MNRDQQKIPEYVLCDLQKRRVYMNDPSLMLVE